MPLTIYPTRAATQASIDNLQTTIAAVATAGAYSGQVDWKLAPNGLPTSGYQKLGGIAVSAPLFRTGRSVVFPWANGVSGKTADAYFIYNVAALGSNILCLSYDRTTRLLNAATLTSVDMPSYPMANYTPGTLGSVNSKFIVAGLDYNGSNGSVYPTIYTLKTDEASPAWTPRANLAQAVISAGTVDVGEGKALVLGGKTQGNYSYSETATNIVDSIQLFDDVANTCVKLSATLPLRMSNVRTAVNASNQTAFVWPGYVSDGATLNSLGRRIWLLNLQTYSSVELDSVPASQSTVTPACMFVDESGRLVIVPAYKPSSGARAWRLDPSAAAGSQWSQIDWDVPEGVTPAALPRSFNSSVTSDGLQLMLYGTAPLLTKCVTVTDYTQLILQAKI